MTNKSFYESETILKDRLSGMDTIKRARILLEKNLTSCGKVKKDMKWQVLI